MVRYDFNQRYSTAKATLEDLRQLKIDGLSEMAPAKKPLIAEPKQDDAEAKRSTVILPTDWDKSYTPPAATTALDSNQDSQNSSDDDNDSSKSE